MGEKDKVEKLLEDYADVFADIVNVLMFQGNRLLQEEDIIPGPTESIYKADSSDLRSQYRDVIKLDRRRQTLFSVIGLENQSVVDPDMVLRVMKYDAISYQAQIDNNDKYRRPVFTIVLYFGMTHWNGPKSLLETLKIDDLPYRDYLPQLRNNPELNLVEVAFLPEEVRNQFTSDFKIVAGYFCALREGRELEFLQTQKEKIRHIPEIFEFFRVFTGNSNITEYLPAIMKRAEEGEPITMKTAFATAIEEVRKMQKETEEMQKETEEMQKKAEELQKEMEKMQKESVKKTKETALKMLSDGMPARKVLEYVEVSPDVLRKWQLELEQNERN